MTERFGHDALISLATVEKGKPYVRTVNSYYENGNFYIITYVLSNKMKQIEKEPEAAVCGNWFAARRVGKSLGYVGKKENALLAGKLQNIFSAWYDNGHVDETDLNTCILCIELTEGALFDHGKNMSWILVNKNVVICRKQDCRPTSNANHIDTPNCPV